MQTFLQNMFAKMLATSYTIFFLFSSDNPWHIFLLPQPYNEISVSNLIHTYV